MAASNQSNKEKTLLNMLKALPSDTWSIDNLTTLLNYRNEAIFQDENLLDDYRDHFESGGMIETVILDKKYHFCPTMFAEHYYGTPDLDFLIMYFAKIPTLHQFNSSTIQCLKPEYLKDINAIMVANKDYITEKRKNPVYIEDVEILT